MQSPEKREAVVEPGHSTRCLLRLWALGPTQCFLGPSGCAVESPGELGVLFMCLYNLYSVRCVIFNVQFDGFR